MANPFLVLGGIAVGIVTASFGILQVPGWVATAQDASAINDLSNLRQAQAVHMNTKGVFTTDLTQLSGASTEAFGGELPVATVAMSANGTFESAPDSGMLFSLSDGVTLAHIGTNPEADAFCTVLRSASGNFIAASDTQTGATSHNDIVSAMDDGNCAPNTRGDLEPAPGLPGVEKQPVPASAIVFRINTTEEGCVNPGVFLNTPTATIDWGDGTTGKAANGRNLHTYTQPGVYDVVVDGTIPGFGDMTTGTAACITAVPQWGETGTTVARSMFAGATNLTYVDAPPAGLTDTIAMFSGATEFNQDLRDWDTSQVTTMRQMFAGATSFNGNVSTWNTSKVKVMSEMFNGATRFNQPLNSWDTSSVTLMLSTFTNSGYNKPLSNWNVSKVMSMYEMFKGAAFNQDISGWNMTGVRTLDRMFMDNKVFNQPIGTWDLATATEFHSMFRGTKSFNNDISAWDMSRGGQMTSMFQDAEGNFGPLGKWDVSKAYNVTDMFNGSKIAVDLSAWELPSQWTPKANFALNSILTGLPVNL